MAATIYLFEDDPDLRALLIELLQCELQASVLACASIVELLRRSAAAPPDLVVADFWGSSQLTLSDGEREQIAALGKVAPTVLVSARQWALDTTSDDLGLAAVVKKPLDIDAFVASLRQVLTAHGADVDSESAIDLPRRDSLSVFLLPWAHGIP